MGVQTFVTPSFRSDTTYWKQKIALFGPKENCVVIKSVTAKDKEGKFVSQQGMKLMIKLNPEQQNLRALNTIILLPVLVK